MWATFWRVLWSPCLFGHEPRWRAIDDRGALVLVCPRCLDRRPVLERMNVE